MSVFIMGLPSHNKEAIPELSKQYLPSISEDHDEEELEDNGLSSFYTSCFIMSGMSGVGLLFLPYVILHLQYVGIALFIVIAGLIGYCSMLLAESWTLVFSGDDTDNEFIRDPYPLIAQRGFSKFGRVLVIILVISQSVLSTMIYLLLAAEIMSDFLRIKMVNDTEENNTRIWILLTLLLVVPLSWFDTPKDNWFVAVLGTLSSLGATVSLATAFYYLPGGNWYNVFREKTFLSKYFNAMELFHSIGLIITCFSGVAIFPNLQQDMTEPHDYGKPIASSSLIKSIFYLVVSVGAVVTIHGHLTPNLLQSLTLVKTLASNPKAYEIATYVSVCCLLVHFMSGAVVHCIPALQYIEIYCDIPQGYEWRRCIIRSSLLTMIMLCSMALPNEVSLIACLGGSVNVFLVIIIPLVCYLNVKKNATKCELIFHSILTLVAIGGAVSMSYFSVNYLFQIAKL